MHGLCFGEEAGAPSLVFFRVKWLQPAMKGTSCVRRVRFGSLRGQSVPPLCSATSGCKSHCNGCMGVYVVLQNALIVINGCMNVAWGWFWGGSRSTKPCLFSCKVAAAGDGRCLVCVCESNPVPKGGSFFAIFVVRFFRPMIKTGGLPDL